MVTPTAPRDAGALFRAGVDTPPGAEFPPGVSWSPGQERRLSYVPQGRPPWLERITDTLPV